MIPEEIEKMLYNVEPTMAWQLKKLYLLLKLKYPEATDIEILIEFMGKFDKLIAEMESEDTK